MKMQEIYQQIDTTQSEKADLPKILLLGATGKLGKAVLQQLVERGQYEIALLIKDLLHRNYQTIYPVKVFEGDITKADSLNKAIQWADMVINCSGYVSYKRSEKKYLRQINIEGVRNIVTTCLKYRKKLIHTSSVVIYGSTRTPVSFTETFQTKNSYKSGYSISKIEAEKIVTQSQLSTIILRPSTLISKEKSTLKNLYNFYKRGYVAGLKGGASFALMEDVAKTYIPAMQILLNTSIEKPLIYNLGGNNLSFTEIFTVFKAVDPRTTLFIPDFIVNLLSRLNDFLIWPVFRKSLITYENYRTGSNYTYVDSMKAIQDLGYQITPFELSLKRIL